MKLENISNDIVKNLALGNSFPNEYDFYKFKKESFSPTLTEKENLLILIMAYRFEIFDLQFVLDINPKDQIVSELLNNVKKEYKNLVCYFEERYGILNQTHFTDDNSYTYLNKPWIGDL